MNNTKFPKLEILDCTIRDGGYLNNWNFDKKIVKEIYRSISKTGVDVIELGFRNVPKSGMGPWYSVGEDMIDGLFKDMGGVRIALMLDYSRADTSNIPLTGNSLVKMYRVACHKDEVSGAIRLCEELKSKGYMTSIQLMGIVGYGNKELEAIVKPLEKSTINYIYFADSYGSLFPQNIKRYIEKFKQTNKKIGFHAHNSLQLAFANTLEAINNGIDIVDGTIYGIGRGSGNLPLEALIIYLEKMLGNKKYNSLPILDLIDRYFISLKDNIKWGYSLPYMLSGIFEIHPNYAKSLVDYHEYKIDDIVKVLEIIKGIGHIGFKKETLDKVVNSGFVGSVDVECPNHTAEEFVSLSKDFPVEYKDRHKAKDFLILANGPSLKEYKSDIDKFINKYSPIVMGANYLGGLFKPHYHGFSNKKRFIDYIDQVDSESKLLLSSSFDTDFINEYTSRSYERAVHLARTSSNFDIKDGIINSNCRTISILLIAVAIVMGAKRIFIAGMDGYKNKENFLSNNIHFYRESAEAENFKLLIEKHNFNEAMLNSINSFLISSDKEDLHIITPTSHNYFYNSIYNWIEAEP